jgi:putative membrane protein
MTTLYAVLLAAGVVLLVVTAVRVLVGGLDDGPDRAKDRTRTANSRARQILDERYAAGELSNEEYEHRVRVLEEGTS